MAFSAQRRVLCEAEAFARLMPHTGPSEASQPVGTDEATGSGRAPRLCSGHRDVTGAGLGLRRDSDPHTGLIPQEALASPHPCPSGNRPKTFQPPQATNPPYVKTSWSRLQQEFSGTCTSTSMSTRCPKTNMSNTAHSSCQPGLAWLTCTGSTPHGHRTPQGPSLQPSQPLSQPSTHFCGLSSSPGSFLFTALPPCPAPGNRKLTSGRNPLPS